MRRIVALYAALSVAVSAVALAGCTSGSTAESASPVASAPSASSTASPAVPSPSETASPAADTTSYIARAKEPEVTVLTEPDGDEEMTVAAEDVLTVPDQTPLVFLVKEIEGSWIEVYLPVRPNGTTGWLPAEDVVMSATDLRVDVDLSDYELTVTDGDTEVLTTEIGLGTDELPTPGGVYYIRELLQPPDPEGTYGPYAYGLSGYSPVLDEFAGGDAVIGIHGTNEPDSFGRSVSHGCIRIPNDVITELVEEIGLPLGTPVHIEE